MQAINADGAKSVNPPYFQEWQRVRERRRSRDAGQPQQPSTDHHTATDVPDDAPKDAGATKQP